MKLWEQLMKNNIVFIVMVFICGCTMDSLLCKSPNFIINEIRDEYMITCDDTSYTNLPQYYSNGELNNEIR
jgi:hypothetical protein